MAAPRAVVAQAEPAEAPGQREYECDMCGSSFSGSPGGSGLLLWTRGEEVRYEEPPLCETCAKKISTRAMMLFNWDEEEE